MVVERENAASDEAASAAATPGRASYREDLVTVLAGTWLVLALFSDGWAHHNVPELEGFFTPWHAALYSGFAASAAWIGVLGLRRGVFVAEGLRAPVAAVRRLPVGYPSAAAGVVVFGIGGVLDLLWHLAFGVEKGIDALVSPSHLTLFVGGMLLLSAPFRGAWRSAIGRAADFRARFPELLSLALTTGLVAFFLLYTSAFLRPGVDEAFTRVPEGAPGHKAAELPAIATLAGYLVTTALVVVPLLLLALRAPLPRGAVTLVLAAVVWLSAAIDEFARIGPAVAVTAAAVVADLLLARLDEVRGTTAPGRLPLLGALVPALLWPAHLIGVAATDAIRYPIALWTGVVVLAVMTGLVLGILAGPVRRRSQQVRRAGESRRAGPVVGPAGRGPAGGTVGPSRQCAGSRCESGAVPPL
jgi:hypothetical protein